MKKLKNTIFRNVAFIMLGLVIFSCQKEDIQDEIQQEEVTKEKIQNLIKSKIPNAVFPTEEIQLTQLKEAKNKGNAIEFETLEAFSKFLDEKDSHQQREGDVLTHEGTLIGGSSEQITTLTYEIAPFINHETIFILNGCDGTIPTSRLTGLTIGKKYKQDASYFTNMGNNSYKTDVSGTITYTIILLGNVEIWSESKRVMHYGNCNC